MAREAESEAENIGIVREISAERYISPEQRQQVVNKVRLIEQCNIIIQEYQKLVKFLDNTPNQPSKFRRKTWLK